MWEDNRHNTGLSMGNISDEEFLRKFIIDVPDYPRKGVTFRDITNLLKDSKAFDTSVSCLLRGFFTKNQIDLVVCIESRGFLLGSAVADRLSCGLVPVRKKGKLPRKVHTSSYDLEYGTDTLELHEDAVLPGQRVLVIDDVLATGGTAKAVVDLVRKSKGELVGLSFLIELTYLKGKEKLEGLNINSVLRY